MSEAFFRIWFAFCALMSVGMFGLIVWAVVTVVKWLVAQ